MTEPLVSILVLLVLAIIAGYFALRAEGKALGKAGPGKMRDAAAGGEPAQGEALDGGGDEDVGGLPRG